MAMNYIGKFLYNFKEFYNEINSATLTGAIDVVVVQQEDGSYLCSPFHVRFGKLGVLRSREKVVDIEINAEPIDIHMKLGESGEAFFVQEVEDVMVPMHLATSPIPIVPDIEAELEQMKKMHGERMKRRDLDSSLEVSGSWKDSKLMHAYLNTSSESTEISKDDTPTDHIHQDSIEISEFNTTQTPWVYNEGEIHSHSPTIEIDECESDIIKTNDNVDQESDFILPQKSASFYVTDSLMLCSVSAEISSSSKTSNETESTSSTQIPIVSKDTQDSIRDREMRMSHSDTAISSITLTNKVLSCGSREQVIESEKIRKKKRRKKLSKSSKDTSVPTVDSEQINSCSETEIVVNEHSNISDTIFDMEVSDGEGPYIPSVVVRTASMPALCEDSMHWNFKAATHYNIHPFSDGDVTPVISSPAVTRPPSPKSDSEYEKRTHDATCQTGEEIKWCWGELPESTTPSGKSKEHDVRKSDKKEKHTSFGSMIPFRRVSKKLPENEGIYLDDLNLDELDPEIAALYFPRSNARQIQTIKDTSHDDDAESGNGPSLPQSPHSVEGSIGGSRMVDSDGESKQSLYEYSSYTTSDITLSLCGGLKGVEGNLPPDRFAQSLVTYEDFVKNPNVLFNPDLVIRIDGKFYNWQIAGPIIMCLLVFQRRLPENALNSLIKEHLPKKRSRMSSWFSWRKSPSTTDVKKSTESIPSNPSSSPPSVPSSPRKTTDIDRIKEEAYVSTSSENEGDIIDESMKRPIKERKFTTGQERFKKSLRLTSDQIARLHLQEGVNEVVFSVTTQYQGTSRCKCHLYLWRYDDKIVISDIDGTITKSDVLGHILPIIGRDWAQSGVAQLFTSIKKNGYQFLYLSARAIGQARITREYLKSIKQGDVSLPEGPLLLSPSSLISALHREVIEKKPEEFKISCLRDIQALFPATRNPFYAGYGNKINDVWAYRAVGIPISRIFTINHRGVLKHELTQTFQSSYFKLQEMVDHVFPPLSHHQLGEVVQAEFNFDASEEYGSFSYWRSPLPDVNIEIQSLLTEEEDSQPSTSKT